MATLYLYKHGDSYSPSQKAIISETASNIVKKIAAKELSLPEKMIEIKKSVNGKPHINTKSNFHFNISHCENTIAVVFDRDEIGVDIEKIRKSDLRICNRFFTEKEKNYIGNSDRKFFEIWTKKEAYLKMNGWALKNLKDADSENIFTKEIMGNIISVSQKNISDINIIILENLEDL